MPCSFKDDLAAAGVFTVVTRRGRDPHAAPGTLVAVAIVVPGTRNLATVATVTAGEPAHGTS